MGCVHLAPCACSSPWSGCACTSSACVEVFLQYFPQASHPFLSASHLWALPHSVREVASFFGKLPLGTRAPAGCPGCVKVILSESQGRALEDDPGSLYGPHSQLLGSSKPTMSMPPFYPLFAGIFTCFLGRNKVIKMCIFLGVSGGSF